MKTGTVSSISGLGTILFALSLLTVTSLLAACAPGTAVETVVVTEVVEVAGEETIVEKIITATPEEPTQEVLVVVSGGGSYEEAILEAIIEPFEQETGVQVIYVSPASEAKVLAQVDSGNPEWDVIELSTLPWRDDVEQYLEPIDYSVFPQEVLDGLYPQAKQEYGVGSITFSTVMAYSTEAYPLGEPRPTTWAEFWDVETYPGQRTLQSSAGGNPSTIEFALLAAGVPEEEIYPLDLDLAFEMLDKIRPNITTFWDVGAQPGQLMIDGEVELASAWNGRVQALREEGAPVDYAWNEGEYVMSSWSVPKGARNKEGAMRFIAYASSAEAQARLNSIMFYGPSNVDAFDFIDPEIASTLPTHPNNFDGQFLRDLGWLQTVTPSGKTNAEILMDRWNSWLLGE